MQSKLFLINTLCLSECFSDNSVVLEGDYMKQICLDGLFCFCCSEHFGKLLWLKWEGRSEFKGGASGPDCCSLVGWTPSCKGAKVTNLIPVRARALTEVGSRLGHVGEEINRCFFFHVDVPLLLFLLFFPPF